MRNVWIGSVAALALACTVGIGAQTTASPATSSNQAASDTITVTGCRKRNESERKLSRDVPIDQHHPCRGERP